MNTFSLSIVVVILIMPVLGFAQENEQFVACKNAAVFKCADKENMPYPFWGTGRPSYCGHPAYELNCTSDAPVITISDIAYRILAIDEDKRAFTVAREDYSTGNCPADKRNATSESDLSFFEYSSDSTTLTLFYKCPVPTTLGMIPYYFNCTGEPLFTNFFGTDEMVNGDLRSLIPQCETTVVVRVSNSQATSLQSAFATPTQQANLTGALSEGFKMEWNANNSRCEGCIESGGQCGSSNSSSAAFSCYCKDGVFLARCGSSSDTSPSASSGSKTSLLWIRSASFLFSVDGTSRN